MLDIPCKAMYIWIKLTQQVIVRIESGGVLDREILKGALEIILLSLLKNKSMYGYEISKMIKKLSDDALIVGEGTLYPALKRLEEKELIKHYFIEVSSSKKIRKYYDITKKGKKELDLKLKDFSIITKLIKNI